MDELVATSAAVTEASSRLVKIARLATLLQRVAPGEVEAAIGFLSGELRQGRVGIGPAVAVKRDRPPALRGPVLQPIEVNEAFERIVATTGPVSAATACAGSVSC